MRVISMPRLIAALATVALATGCNDHTGPDLDQGPRSTGGMTIAPSNAMLRPGESIVLRAYLINSSGDALAGQPVSWTSSNLSVATVSQGGEVRALTSGVAVIRAEALGRAQIAYIRVLPAGRPSKPLALIKPNIEPARRQG